MPSKKSAAISRLKSDLKDVGLIKQKSKKSRISKQTETSEKRKAFAALKAKQINPFELKMTKPKHEVLGRKVKGVLGKPGLSKKKSIQIRQQKLLPEIMTSNKETVFDDKRIGENNVNMSIEDKMFERFVSEQKKRASKGTFNLEDSELTHMGKSLDDFDGGFPSMESDEDETNGAIGFETVRGAHFGGFEDDEKEKSRAEIMKEVMAKSKFHKYERQKQKEEDIELGDELDAELDLVRGLLQPNKPNSKSSVKSSSKSDSLPSQRDAYDLFVRELATERRAQPTDRLKTEEEVALEEKEMLEKMEEERIKRMQGTQGNSSSVAKRVPRADDLDDFGFDEGSKTGAALAYKDGKIVNNEIFIKPSNNTGTESGESQSDSSESEGESSADSKEDSCGDDSEGESDFGSENEQEDCADESENEQEDCADGSEEESTDSESQDDQQVSVVGSAEEQQVSEDSFLKKQEANVQITATPKGAHEIVQKSIPFLIEAPNDLADFTNIIENQAPQAIDTIIKRVRVLNHVKLGPSNKEKLITLHKILVAHTMKLCSSADLYNAEAINVIFKHLHELCLQFPAEATALFKEKLSKIEQQFISKPRYPSPSQLILFKMIAQVFSVSDFRNQLTVPLMTVINQCLSQLPIQSMKQTFNGLVMCLLNLNMVQQTRRMHPEALGYLYRVINCFGYVLDVSSRTFPLHPRDTLLSEVDGSPQDPQGSLQITIDSSKTQKNSKSLIQSPVVSPTPSKSSFKHLFNPQDIDAR